MTTTNQAPRLRPGAEHLAALPTQAVMTPESSGEAIQDFARSRGVKFRLELKLETDAFKFWLCTQGWDRPGNDPEGWTPGYVTMESKVPAEDGTCSMLAYGPEDLKRLQGIDYFYLLAAQLAPLLERRKQGTSWELEKEITQVAAEMDRVTTALKKARKERIAKKQMGGAS